MQFSGFYFRYFVLILLIQFGFTACGGSSTPAPAYTISVGFERIPSAGLDPFSVTATVLKNGSPVSGIANQLHVSLGRGTSGAITDIGAGQYQFTVTPTQTGEYEVTVSYLTASISRTALVLADVHADWGQPMAVAGLVNTPGYEDGVTVTSDGEYLFVQYGPWYFSAIQLFLTARASGGCEGNRLEYPLGTPNRCTHDWLDNTIGPYTGPERPGFFDGRISNGMNLHNANSWMVGIDGSPIFAPSTMFYGFKRQADGSFAEPFYIAFEDVNDGIINPYGMSFLLNGDGTATMTFTVDDPPNTDIVDVNNDGMTLVESGHDVYTNTITLGQNNSLGTYIARGVASTPPVRGTPFTSTLVNFGKTGTEGIYGTQGNSHIYAESNVIKSIWTDDEQDSDSDRGELSVYVLTSGTFPDGSWTKQVLPSNINQPSPSNEIQPFFTGSGLYFTHSSNTELPEVFYANYSGPQTLAGYQNNANWGTPIKLLSADTFGVGNIVAVGEPTIANYQGHEYLYFVYAYIREFDPVSGLPDINMQAGYIVRN